MCSIAGWPVSPWFLAAYQQEMPASEQHSLRIEPELDARVDRLLAKLAEKRWDGLKQSKAKGLRYILLKGVERLEQELEKE